MHVPPAENATCTFAKTGVCHCKKNKTTSTMANTTSAQTKVKITGVVSR